MFRHLRTIGLLVLLGFVIGLVAHGLRSTPRPAGVPSGAEQELRRTPEEGTTAAPAPAAVKPARLRIVRIRPASV